MAGNLGKTRDGTPSRRKKAAPKKEVAGPYRSQSSVPSIKAKATKHEHRKVKAKPKTKAKARARATDPLAIPALTASGLTKRQRKDAQTNRAIRALLKPPKT